MANRPYIFHDDAEAAADGNKADVRGMGTVVVQIVGITTATVTWKASIDGSTFATIMATPLATGTAATTATADGLYRIDTRGLGELMADITAYTSGTITITGYGVKE